MISGTGRSLAVLCGLGAFVFPVAVQARPSAEENHRLHELVTTKHVTTTAKHETTTAKHETTTAKHADPKGVKSTQSQGLSPDLGYGQLPLPLPAAQVRAIERFHKQFGPHIPPIPKSLTGPFTPAQIAAIEYRQALILEIFREMSLTAPGNVAGGIYFQPPLGTPYTPVKPVNVFTYFPVFRIGVP